MKENALAFPKRIRWVHWLPIVHLALCLSYILGVATRLTPLVMVSQFLIIVDLPLSIVTVGLAFSHQVIAIVWLVVVGTLWWYLLAIGAEFVFNRFISRTYVGR